MQVQLNKIIKIKRRATSQRRLLITKVQYVTLVDHIKKKRFNLSLDHKNSFVILYFKT